jgi:serine/threonine protein kinase
MIDDPLIGRQLANFRIERVLGRGGMAQVYFGQDVKLNRPVAIKVIDARFRGNPAYAKRFVREAQAVATWRHENIAQVHYADEDGDLYYFVMEYIDGLDLGELISQYTGQGELMPHADVLRIGHAVASALDYAHQKGVIHRDVKPSNVMVARDGRVVLSDFGLALDVQQGSMGDVFGTAHYIAPEQARRSSDAVPQSDLYSLGVILYEMLTGVVPFDDPSPTAVAIQHITQKPPSPREINTDLGAEAEAVLLKALSKSPNDRYQSGGELMAALESALRTSPVAAVVVPAPLPLLPAGVRPPTARLSRMTVADVMALQPEPKLAPPVSPSAPRQTPSSAPAALPLQRPTTVPRRNPVMLFTLGGCSLVILALTVVGGLLLLSQPNSFFQGAARSTETGTVTTQAAVVSPTLAPPTETLQPVASTDIALESTATSVPTAESPTAEPSTPVAVPTVKYPNGKRFMLYYDNNSLYLLNLSESVVSIYSVAFERLDAASGAPLNRFDGWRWAQFYPNSKPDWCMAIEILSSPSYLRPSECTKGNLSTRTPTRDDPVVFWTAQEGSQQFRVLWKQGGPEEEVARCEIGAGTCEVFFP